MITQTLESQVLQYDIPIEQEDVVYPKYVTTIFGGLHYNPHYLRWAQDLTDGGKLRGIEAIPKFPGSKETFIWQWAVVTTDYYPSFDLIWWKINSDGAVMGTVRQRSFNGGDITDPEWAEPVGATAGLIQLDWIKQTRLGYFWFNYNNPVFGGLGKYAVADVNADRPLIYVVGSEIDKGTLLDGFFEGGFRMGGEKFLCEDEIENVALIITSLTPFGAISVHSMEDGSLIRHIVVGGGEPIDCFWENERCAYVMTDDGIFTLVNYITGEILSVTKFDRPVLDPTVMTSKQYRHGWNAGYDRVMKRFLFSAITPNIGSIAGNHGTLVIKGYKLVPQPTRIMKPVPLRRSIVGRSTRIATRLLGDMNEPVGGGFVTASMSNANGALWSEVAALAPNGFANFVIDCNLTGDDIITVNTTGLPAFTRTIYPEFYEDDGSAKPPETTEEMAAADASYSMTYEVGPASLYAYGYGPPPAPYAGARFTTTLEESDVHYSTRQRVTLSGGGTFYQHIDRVFNIRVLTYEQITWTPRVTPSSQWTSLAWSPELGLMVSVASTRGDMAAYADAPHPEDWDTLAMTSADGETWEGVTGVPISYWTELAWCPTPGRFVATAATPVSNRRSMTSTDGENWAINTDAPALAFTRLLWVDGLNKLVGVANDSSIGTPRHMVGTTADGLTWTTHVAPAQGWMDVAWSPSLGLLVAVSRNGTQRVMTSPDGEVWTARTCPMGNWNRVTWSPALGMFVALTGFSNPVDGSADNVGAMRSSDGINWTAITGLPAPRTWENLVWSPERALFIATGYAATITPPEYNYLLVEMIVDLTALVMTSDDGILWKEQIGLLESADREQRWRRGGIWCSDLGRLVMVMDTAAEATVGGTLHASDYKVASSTGIPGIGATRYFLGVSYSVTYSVDPP